MTVQDMDICLNISTEPAAKASKGKNVKEHDSVRSSLNALKGKAIGKSKDKVLKGNRQKQILNVQTINSKKRVKQKALAEIVAKKLKDSRTVGRSINVQQKAQSKVKTQGQRVNLKSEKSQGTVDETSVGSQINNTGINKSLVNAEDESSETPAIKFTKISSENFGRTILAKKRDISQSNSLKSLSEIFSKLPKSKDIKINTVNSTESLDTEENVDSGKEDKSEKYVKPPSHTSKARFDNKKGKTGVNKFERKDGTKTKDSYTNQKAGKITSLYNHNPEIPNIGQRLVKPINEPVFAGKTFTDLNVHPFMVSNLEQNMQITKLTTVQQKAIPVILSGKDVLIRSQTGSGKTLTYALPIVEQLHQVRPKLDRHSGLKALVVVPTRELALQTYECFLKLIRPFTWIVPGYLSGGEKRKAEKARLRKGCNILVGTPGRILDHIKRTAALKLSQVKYFVLDEADRMFDMGYEKDISGIVKALKILTPENPNYHAEQLLRGSFDKDISERDKASLQRHNDGKEVQIVFPKSTPGPSETIIPDDAEYNPLNILRKNIKKDDKNEGQNGGEVHDKKSDTGFPKFAVRLPKIPESSPDEGDTGYNPLKLLRKNITKTDVSDKNEDSEGHNGNTDRNSKKSNTGFPKFAQRATKKSETPLRESNTGYDPMKLLRKNVNKGSSDLNDTREKNEDEEDDTNKMKNKPVYNSSGDEDDNGEPYVKSKKGDKKKMDSKSTVENIETVKEKEDEDQSERQTILLSATLTQAVESLAGLAMKNPIFVDAAKENLQKSGGDASDINEDLVVPQSVVQSYIITPPKLRMVTLSAYIAGRCQRQGEQKMLVFMATQDMVDYHADILSSVLTKPMDENDDDSDPLVDVEFFKLHGNMTQKERTDVFKTFRQTKSGVLLCTDVAARGLDLPKVDCVVQYTGPLSARDYVHRIGRTARAGSSGTATIFLTPPEVEFVRMLESKRIRIKQENMEDVLDKLLGPFSMHHTSRGAAIALHSEFEDLVLENSKLRDKACKAYTSWVRFYASYPREMREAFNRKDLHLGHFAKSFALRETPQRIGGIGKTLREKDRSRLPHNNRLTNEEPDGVPQKKRQQRQDGKAGVGLLKRVRMLNTSEFASGLETAKKPKKS